MDCGQVYAVDFVLKCSTLNILYMALSVDFFKVPRFHWEAMSMAHIPTASDPICPLCSQPVELESAKIDDEEQPAHEVLHF